MTKAELITGAELLRSFTDVLYLTNQGQMLPEV